MKLIINGYTVEAKPEDLASVLTAKQPKKIPVQSGFFGEGVKEAAAPLQNTLNDTVRQSEELRKKLAEDPNYNPYPGVLPSAEPAVPTQQYNREYAAERDTGIDYE